MKKIAAAILLIPVLFSCRKTPVTNQAKPIVLTTDCHCRMEEAFPDIKGETLTFSNGKEQIQIVKKGDYYVFLGDILLTPRQVNLLMQYYSSKTTNSTGMANFTQLWPNHTVYYTINAGLPNQQRVTDAIAHWQANTNLQFVPRTTQANYIEFISAGECGSNVGMVGGKQQILLGTGCTTGNAIHEIGHAIGFYHEQSRADRDNWITINWNNIASGYASQFQTYTQSGLSGFQIGNLDFNSIMLYDSYAFSGNGLPTITTTTGGTFTVQRNGLSALDIATYNYMYNPPYVSMVAVNVYYDYPLGGPYTYQGDYEVRFYSDAARTQPVSITYPITLRFNTLAWNDCQGMNYPPVPGYTVTAPAGTSVIGVGSFSYYNQFDASENPIMCHGFDDFLANGVGYRN